MGTYNHAHRDTQRLLPTGLQGNLSQHAQVCTHARAHTTTHTETHSGSYPLASKRPLANTHGMCMHSAHAHVCVRAHICTHIYTHAHPPTCAHTSAHTHRLCTACLTENGNLKGPQKGLPWRLQKGLRLCQGPPQGLGMVTLCPGPASRPSWPSAKASQWRAKAQGGPSVALGQQEHPFLDTLERARRGQGQGQGLGSRVGAPEPDCPAQPTRPQSRATALPGFLHLGGFP